MNPSRASIIKFELQLAPPLVPRKGQQLIYQLSLPVIKKIIDRSLTPFVCRWVDWFFQGLALVDKGRDMVRRSMHPLTGHTYSKLRLPLAVRALHQFG